MRRFGKIVVWILGACILFMLIRMPIDQFQNSWKNTVSPLTGKVIVIDPGHGGADGGAKSKTGTDEKNIALDVAKMTRTYLESSGAIVYLTRETDVDLADTDVKGLSNRKSIDIRKRLDFIHEKNPDIFISIHLNALHSSRWSGAQTFFHNSQTKNEHLATTIQSEIIRNLENTNRVPLEMNSVYLLKHATVPGALVELGFLSNEKEALLLQEKDYQTKLAASIYQGILEFFTVEVVELDEEL